MRNICDYMIIQRDADGFGKGVFSGTFEPRDNCTVVARVMREEDNQMIVPWMECEINDKEWKIELSIPQGGLYRVEARITINHLCPTNNRNDWGDLIACASHVGVGDVFVMAGQSNMSGYGREPVFDPPQLGVHLFDNAGNWVLASHPLNSVPNPIYCNNDDGSGVSPGLAFGKTMLRNLGVPVGLVAAARGGSSLEDWDPELDDPFLYTALAQKLNEIGDFKAMIWYQGCNDASNDEESPIYLERFKETVSAWRRIHGYFPIVTCQMNRHAFKDGGNDLWWGLVREAQRRAAIEIDDVFVIPTLDMTTIDGIHNSSASCIAIGERMASTMLKGVYNLPGSLAPSIKSVKKIDKDSVLLTFYGEHTLRTMDDIAEGINIEDENGMMNCLKITACDEGAIVKAEREIGKNALFHAYWRRVVPAFFLRDVYGMPMLACYGVTIED